MAGTQSLGHFSQQFSNEVHARLTKQMRIYGENIVYKAVSLAPRGKTGDLARSISYKLDEATYTLSFIVGVPYGIFVEFGTRHMRPQPYLRPAINWNMPIYGIQPEMMFTNTPRIRAPILAQGKGFHLPSTLTQGQLTHVRQHLKPESKKQWEHRSGNVRHTKLTVRHR